MAVTVKRALQLPELSSVRPVAGLDGLDNVVRWVHVMNLPCMNMVEWIRGGELLLSTGYLWPRAPDQQRRGVRALSSAGLSALLLTVGKYFHDDIPTPILEAANAVGLPVLRGPWELKFVDVAEAVQREIMGQQLSLISTSEKIQRTLIEVSLRNPGLLGLAQSLAKLVENRVAIEDDRFRLLVVADPASPAGQEERVRFPGIVDRVAREPSLAFQLQASHGPLHFAASASHGLPEAIVCPIRADQDLCGYLTIVATQTPLEALHKAAAEHGARIAALEMTRHQSSQEPAGRLEGNFVAALLKGDLAHQPESAARASFYGIAPQKRHQVALLESRLEDRSLQARLRVLLAAEGLRPVIAAVDGRTAVVFEEPETERADLPGVLAQLLSEDTGVLAPDSRAALSQVAGGLEGIARGYRQALTALQIAERLMQRQRLLRYDDLRTYRLLDTMADKTVLEDYVREVLGPLARPKTKFERDLRTTIDVLVDRQFSQAEAARALYLHKNSMRYRVRKIEEATGLQLTRHDHTHQIQLAVEADRLLSVRDTTTPHRPAISAH